jgi:hypothetical protein
MIINVTRDANGDSILEVSNEDKKLTVFLHKAIDILCVHGQEIGQDNFNEIDFYEAWKWVTDNQ